MSPEIIIRVGKTDICVEIKHPKTAALAASLLEKEVNSRYVKIYTEQFYPEEKVSPKEKEVTKELKNLANALKSSLYG